MPDHDLALRGLPRWHPDPLVRATLDRIRRYGWAVTAVGNECQHDSPTCVPPECAFAYTTGLRLHELPEMAIYGLDARTAGAVLNELGHLFHRHDWRAAVRGRVAVELDSLNVPVTLIELVDKSDLLITNAVYPDAPVVQAVWPDELGSYPWEDGYLLTPADQLVRGVYDADSRPEPGPRIIHSSAGLNRAQRRRVARRRA